MGLGALIRSGIEKGRFIRSAKDFRRLDRTRSKGIGSEMVIEVNQSGLALRQSRSLLKVSRYMGRKIRL